MKSPMLITIERRERRKSIREFVMETIALIFLIGAIGAIVFLAGCSPPIHGEPSPATPIVSEIDPHTVSFDAPETAFCVECHAGLDGDDDHPLTDTFGCTSCHVNGSIVACTTCHNR